MPPAEYPDPGKFLAARTAPLRDPNPAWFRTVLGRMVARYSPLRTLDERIAAPEHFTEYNEDSNDVPFWLLPARPLDAWWDHGTGTFVPFGFRGSCSHGEIDVPYFDRVLELFRTVQPGYCMLEVHGHADKVRHSRPHVEVDLNRRWNGFWFLQVRLNPSHPLCADEKFGPEAADIVRDGLGRVDEDDGMNWAEAGIFMRSGMPDQDEAYHWFHSALRASMPYPSVWSVSHSVGFKEWPAWLDTLNAFRPAWSYTPCMQYRAAVDVFKRPARVEPGRPLRYPVASWPVGGPPNLQVDVIHAAEGSWLECQTVRPRDRLDDVAGLIGPLEFWDGPPELRWSD